MKKLDWYIWVLFGIATLFALTISWWSMYTLGTETFHMNQILVGTVASGFDLAGLFLGLIAINYAKSRESGFSVTVYTFLIILTSAGINGYHAYLENFGLIGIVFFASASILSGVLLKVILDYLHKEMLTANGRTVRKLPKIGLLAWLLNRKDSFSLLRMAIQDRIQSGWLNYVSHDDVTISQIEEAFAKQEAKAQFANRQFLTSSQTQEIEKVSENDEKIFAEVEKITEKDLRSENSQLLKQEDSEKSIENQVENVFAEIPNDEKPENEDFSIPSYLEKGMSLRKIAALMFENESGEVDLDQAFEFAVALNPEKIIKRDSVSKAISAARKEASTNN